MYMPKITEYYLVMALVVVAFTASLISLASADNFNSDVSLTFGNERVKIFNEGRDLTLSMDNSSGSGVRSNNEYLLGRFDIQIKLIPGNSAGTVTTFYLTSSPDQHHDEIDFEFLGNLNGKPYILNTNVFTQGQGGREQQFYLWFDPTASFHNYSLVWHPRHIIFFVDNFPIRLFHNYETQGVPYPTKQPMKVLASLWNPDNWGMKIDWAKAPFIASYRNINLDANCVVSPSSSCKFAKPITSAWQKQYFDPAGRKHYQWVRKNYMIYNYCTDTKRFPQGVPSECKLVKS